MSHSKVGYAVVQWKYIFASTESQPLTPGRAGFQTQYANPQIAERIIDLGSTNWAKCRKNQTGDKYITQRISGVVLPAARAQVEAHIRHRNQENARRRAAWRTRDGGKLVAQGQQPPRLRDLGPFQSDRLRIVGNPYCGEKKPDFGLEMPWVRI